MKGREGKGMENKKEFLSIHMVGPSIATLFLKGLLENNNFNTTKAE